MFVCIITAEKLQSWMWEARRNETMNKKEEVVF